MALPIFPPELLHIIVDEVASFHDEDTLRSCNATSRSLSQLARQHLFKCIVFNEDNYDDDIDGMFSDMMTFYDQLSPHRATHLGISQYVKEVSFILIVPITRRWKLKLFYLLRDSRFAKTLNLLSHQCRLTKFGFCLDHGFVEWFDLTQGFRKAFTSIIDSPHIRNLEIHGLSSVPIDLFDQCHATNLSLHCVTPDSTTHLLHHKATEPQLRLVSLRTNLSFNMVQVYANSSGSQRQFTHPISISQLKTLIAAIEVPDIPQICNLLKANDGSLELLELNNGCDSLDFRQFGAIDFGHFCNLKTLNISPPFPPPFTPYESRSSFQFDQVLGFLQGSSDNVPLQHLKAKIGFGIPARVENFLEDACAPGSKLDALDAILSNVRFSKLRVVQIIFWFPSGTHDPASLHPYFPAWLPRMFPRLSKSTNVAIKLTSV